MIIDRFLDKFQFLQQNEFILKLELAPIGDSPTSREKRVPKLFLINPATQEKLLYFDVASGWPMKHWLADMQGYPLIRMRITSAWGKHATKVFVSCLEKDDTDDYKFDQNSPSLIGTLQRVSYNYRKGWDFLLPNGIPLFRFRPPKRPNIKGMHYLALPIDDHANDFNAIAEAIGKITLWREYNLFFTPKIDLLTRFGFLLAIGFEVR